MPNETARYGARLGSVKSDGQPRREPAMTMYLSAADLGLGSSITVGLLLMMSS